MPHIDHTDHEQITEIVIQHVTKVLDLAIEHNQVRLLPLLYITGFDNHAWKRRFINQMAYCM